MPCRSLLYPPAQEPEKRSKHGSILSGNLRLSRVNSQSKSTNHVLFIDARHTFQQVSRAHRELTTAQVEFLSNIVRLWRGEAVESYSGGQKILESVFGAVSYLDVAGLCKVCTWEEIQAQDWSLNPGRYVGTKTGVVKDEEDFQLGLEAMQEELELLNVEAIRLHEIVDHNIAKVLQA